MEAPCGALFSSTLPLSGAFGYNDTMLRTLIPILIATLALPATAEIYKCRLPDGKTEIANTPCPSGSATVTVRPSEPVSESSRQQAERDVERMRDYVERREAAQRADTRAERQERASPPQPVASPPRTYGDPDACLRDLDQQVLEATQRAYLEAECRRLIRPPTSTVQQPVPVYAPYVPYGMPHHPPAPPRPVTPARPEPPAGPPTVICAPSSKNCK